MAVTTNSNHDTVDPDHQDRRRRLARSCVNLSLLTSREIAADLIDRAIDHHAHLADDGAGDPVTNVPE